MCINEIENNADVQFVAKSKEDSVFKGHYVWESRFTGSSFCTQTTDWLEVSQSRQNNDKNFPFSQIEAFLSENRYNLSPEQLESLKTRFMQARISKGCLSRSDMFCTFDGLCSDCKNVVFSFDEEELSLA